MIRENLSTVDKTSLDIVAKKNGGMRGQAFVVFEEQTAATAAMRGVTGKTFYGKLLVSVTPAYQPIVQGYTS
jgi:RNA recognition motif-containing protein